LWDGTDTLATFTTSTPGTHWVTVTDTNGCQGTDSMMLTVLPLPVADLGPDLAVCAGDSVSLDADPGDLYPSASFAWAHGPTTETVTVASAGTYSVTMSVDGCEAADSITVAAIASPTLSLPPDSAGCAVAPYAVTATASGDGIRYLWSSGDTTATTTVTGPGTYTVTVWNECDTLSATYTLTALPPPVPVLADTSICAATSVTLSLPDLYASYTWDGTVTTPTFTTSTPGPHWVTVTDSNGCVGSDTATLSLFPLPVPALPDTATCSSLTLTLSLPTSYTSYLWIDGSTGPTITVDTTGTYWVQVTDSNGCVGSDTATVAFNSGEPPQVDLGPDLALCGMQTRVMRSQQPCNGCSHMWSTGETAEELTIGQTGTYALTVTNACGSATDSILVTILGEDGVYVPNVFSPNGDGINDYYGVTVPTPEEFSLEILSRWGERVFESTHPSVVWDGRLGGTEVPEGVYLLHLRTKSCNGENRHVTGTVTLVR
jgi:gliding motility-associated-like protein